MTNSRKYKRQIDRIVSKWAAHRSDALAGDDIEKQNRWPAGAQGGKGGQFAPTQGGGGSKLTGAGKFSSYASLFGENSKFPGGESPAWGAKQDAKPAAPPPGAKPHLHKNDKGQPVTINYPTQASDKASWTDAKRTATFTPGSATPAELNGVPMKPWAAAPRSENEWANVPGQDNRIDANHPFSPTPGKSVGAGVIVREPDGRIWLTKPTNHFGGYAQTFPKGTVEHGLSMQASAIKEAYEETGLQVRITGVLGDYERTTSKARFYIAERVGGTPAAMGWESQAIRLAPAKDALKLLNMKVDKEIFDDLEMEGFFEKSAKKGGAGWQKQDRWPGGTPLGGQWKSMDGAGLTIPPTIAGGLGGTNPQYQKKVNAAYAMASDGQKAALLDSAIDLEKKVQAYQAAGNKTGHAKKLAMVSQYLTQLAKDSFGAPKAEAVAARLTGPLKISALTHSAPKPGGSNPGAVMTDAKGQKWLVKGNAAAGSTGAKISDDRARNEVLAAKLTLAAGAGGVDMKMVDMEGQHGAAKSGAGSLGVASKMLDGLAKVDISNPAHLAAVQKDFAVQAWLGNWDVLGAGLDNTRIDKDGKAVCIDPGGALLFRAQGAPKAAGAFGKDAADFESMRTTDHHQKSIYGKMTKSQLAESAKALAGVTDDTIKELVKSYGPGDEKAKEHLAATLIARRDAIMSKAGLTKDATLAGAAGAPAVAHDAPSAAPVPPKVTEAVKPAHTGGAGLPTKPAFDDSFKKAGYYDEMAQKMLDAHAAGNLDALKGLAKAYNGTPAWPAKTVNGKLMQPFHDALVADLEKQKGIAAQAVANGNASVTGKDGTAWQADDKGVLQPAAASAGKTAKPDYDTLYDAVQATGMNMNAQKWTATQSAMWDAGITGNLDALNTFQPITASGKKMKEAILSVFGQARPAAPAVAAAPQPAPKVPTAAAPNFAAAKLPDSNTNAPSHNKKVDAISAAFAAGDEKAILSMNFGIGNLSGKQASLANDALAAMGSVHQVAKGQAKNSHPALLGGAGQPGTIAPASAAPKAGTAPKTRTLAELTVDKLPAPPDMLNFKGPGAAYSQHKWKNDANTAALMAMQQAALTGGMQAVDALKFPQLDPNTGAPTGKMVSAAEHPAQKVIGVYAQSLEHAINDFLNPPKKLEAFNVVNAKSVQDVAAQFLGTHIGTTVANQPKEHQFGFWLALGKVADKASVAPANVRDMTEAEYQTGYDKYKKYSALTKKWIYQTQSSGVINRRIDEGHKTYTGQLSAGGPAETIDIKEMTKAIYADANPVAAGSTLYRWQDMPHGMLKQIESAEPGLVFQSLGGFCTSQHPTATKHFGQHYLKIRVAEGAKAIHSHGSGRMQTEKELTTIPGQRFVLLDKSWNAAKSRWDIELLMLPPDETFLA